MTVRLLFELLINKDKEKGQSEMFRDCGLGALEEGRYATEIKTY